jgi:Ca2+-binding RTX toxin-like protein
VVGSAGDNNIQGLDGNDILVGGGGNDFLWGGSGADAFVFNDLDEGSDTILDFTTGIGGDVLDFSAFDLADESAALGLGTQVEGDVVFTLSGGTVVTLANVQLTNMDGANFLL